MRTYTSWRGLLADIERTQTANGRIDTTCFSLEGVRLLERALRAGAPLQAVLASESFAAAGQARPQALLAALTAANVPLLTAPDAAITAVTHGRGLGDVLALVALPPSQTVADLVGDTAAPLLLVAADIVDPGNVGALVRTAHASGADALVALGRSDPFHPKAVRTSMGSLFKLPLARYTTAVSLLADCRGAGVRALGTVSAGGVPLMAADLRKGTAVFVGNEYEGLGDAVAARLDARLTIPMTAGVDSYSVNAAAAIILYEAARQRLAMQ